MIKLSKKENSTLQAALFEDMLVASYGERYAATAEGASDMAVQELQKAVGDPSYLDKIWNWMGSVKDRLGNQWFEFIDLVKRKGSAILQQLGITENQLASLGAPTTYS